MDRKNSKMHTHWKESLYDKYRWLGQIPADGDLVEAVRKIISIIEKDNNGPIVSVSGSSTWAVCMSYLMYCGYNDVLLSDTDMEYTRSRGGVIGCYVFGGAVILTTIREFLEERDVGFAYFTGSIQHKGVPAA